MVRNLWSYVSIDEKIDVECGNRSETSCFEQLAYSLPYRNYVRRGSCLHHTFTEFLSIFVPFFYCLLFVCVDMEYATMYMFIQLLILSIDESLCIASFDWNPLKEIFAKKITSISNNIWWNNYAQDIDRNMIIKIRFYMLFTYIFCKEMRYACSISAQ